MICAVIDYLRYRRGVGPYSERELAKKDGHLASPENLPDLSELEAGDIFFVHTRGSFLSWIVMYMTGGAWAHVGSFSYDGQVVDATTSGVIKHSFLDYFDGQSYIAVYRHQGLTDEDRAAIVAELESHIGEGYGWELAVWLGVRQLLGLQPKYLLRHALDIGTACALLASVGVWFPSASTWAFGILGTYYAVVAFNLIRRRLGFGGRTAALLRF